MTAYHRYPNTLVELIVSEKLLVLTKFSSRLLIISIGTECGKYV